MQGKIPTSIHQSSSAGPVAIAPASKQAEITPPPAPSPAAVATAPPETELVPETAAASAAPVTPSENALTQEPSKPAATSIAPPVASPATQTLVDPSLRKLLQTSRAWLTNQQPQSFSLQLALIETDAVQINRYLHKIKSQINPQEIYVYPTRVGEHARIGILYGSFSRRSDAILMQKKLAELHDHEPQLRTIMGIKTEIERTNSKDLWLSDAI